MSQLCFHSTDINGHDGYASDDCFYSPVYMRPFCSVTMEKKEHFVLLGMYLCVLRIVGIKDWESETHPSRP